jgi:hypothetical protein
MLLICMKKSTLMFKDFLRVYLLLNYEPTKRSVRFMSKLNWKELVPYMKKIYGQEYTEIFVNRLKENN